jgi:hypothetical protein
VPHILPHPAEAVGGAKRPRNVLDPRYSGRGIDDVGG